MTLSGSLRRAMSFAVWARMFALGQGAVVVGLYYEAWTESLTRRIVESDPFAAALVAGMGVAILLCYLETLATVVRCAELVPRWVRAIPYFFYGAVMVVMANAALVSIPPSLALGLDYLYYGLGLMVFSWRIAQDHDLFIAALR